MKSNRKEKFILMTVFGILLFFTGLYGVGKSFSFEICLVGLALLTAGIIGLIVTLTPIRLHTPHKAVISLAALALALKIYEQILSTASGLSVGWLLWGFVPYILCLGVSALENTRTAAIGGVVIALLFDSIMHFAVFIKPHSSTAGLALIFGPIWSTLVFVPLSIFVTQIFLKKRRKKSFPRSPPI